LLTITHEIKNQIKDGVVKKDAFKVEKIAVIQNTSINLNLQGTKKIAQVIKFSISLDN